MTVSMGARLGPYEILGPLGSGGMGEVYRARDTRLDRLVAIKILPSEFVDRVDRRQRFEQEVRAISSVSHPHICAVYDVGDEDGVLFLVMEYLDGETLAHRLLRGPLSAQEMLAYAIEIASALDYSHSQGVVHRDLKPSNVMLTRSGTKLLDFGLAKVRTGESASSCSTLAMPRALTTEGTLVGTVQYMAPEQLEGKPIDDRTDIFAFGALVHEMATGRKAFEGDSQAAVMAAILKTAPPSISALAPAIPQAVDRIVERCLAKNAEERWQSARDLTHELRWIAAQASLGDPPTGATRVGGVFRAAASDRPWLAWSGAAVAGAAAATTVLLFMSRTPAAHTVRLSVPIPAGMAIVPHEVRTDLAISPDGRRLAFVATKEGHTELWVRSFDAEASYALAGTDGAYSPFWSPDSRFIGFATEGKLKRIDPAGGPPLVICDGQLESVASWSGDGTILFSKSLDGIYRVSADGGSVRRVTKPDASRREVDHLWPHFLPGGRRFLFVVTSRSPDHLGLSHTVHVADLDTATQHALFQADSRVEYAAPGFLLYVRDGTLLAHAFDVDALKFAGAPMSVVDHLHYFKSAANAGFSVSQAGVLAYHVGISTSRLAWFDRKGNETGVIGAPGVYGAVRISPGGDQVAMEAMDPRSGTSDVWIHDTKRDTSTRLTSDPGNEADPIWSPDGRHIVFRSDRDGPPDLHERTLSDATETVLLERAGVQRPTDWSADGRWLTFTEEDRETGHSLWILSLQGDRRATPYLRTRFQEGAATFAPDGNSLAFVSDESGSPEVYMAPVANAGTKLRLSTAGGFAPRWRRDGKELFYLEPGNRLMRVPMTLGARFEAGAPVPLFRVAAAVAFTRRTWYTAFDVAPDGQRFLLNLIVDDAASTPPTVVLNWNAGLKN